MNKPLIVLTLLCGFLMGVIAGPWLWPRGLSQAPQTDPAPPPVAMATAIPPAAAEPVTEQEAVNPEMQLKGVFVADDGSRSVALIQTGDSQPQPYRVEQKLPNGYAVKTISRNMVEVEKNGDTVGLSLVRAKASKPDEIASKEAADPAVSATELPIEPAVAPTPATAVDKPAQTVTPADGSEPSA